LPLEVLTGALRGEARNTALQLAALWPDAHHLAEARYEVAPHAANARPMLW
jgi:hypothetical protein